MVELGRRRGVEELGDEVPYSFGVVFLEEVAAVWEGGELGFEGGELTGDFGAGLDEAATGRASLVSKRRTCAGFVGSRNLRA